MPPSMAKASHYSMAEDSLSANLAFIIFYSGTKRFSSKFASSLGLCIYHHVMLSHPAANDNEIAGLARYSQPCKSFQKVKKKNFKICLIHFVLKLLRFSKSVFKRS